MNIGSREHDDIMLQFEKDFSHLRLDREPLELWKKGQTYQNGETNHMFKAYILGYSLGRCQYLN